MKVEDLEIGMKLKFVGCNTCKGKKEIKCFFCQPKVKPVGKVVATYFDFSIPTVEVDVKGSQKLLELSQADLDDPCLVERIIE